MIDPSAQACTAQGLQRVGLAVTVQRISGFAPRVVTVSADVTAIVRLVIAATVEEAQTGYGASNPGAITQGDRQLIVMAADLAAKRFPLPIVKGDRIIVAATGETFNVTKVDPYRRALAGAIELVATGVA